MPRATKISLPDIPHLSKAPARLFVGTSGWAYPAWKPDFYPEGLAARKFLTYYASKMNSVEVNYSFRKLPTAKMISNWLALTPPGFQFSFKAPQRITHFKRLRDCEDLVSEFVKTLDPVHAAGKLGLLLFRLPPNFKADAERLRGFLAAPALRSPDAPPIAFEFRHESWFTPEIEAVLSDGNAALCIAESDDLRSPEMYPATTHTSFRLRRNGGYSPAQIRVFAKKFVQLAATRDVYVYCKHEDEPTGALNAASLLKRALTEAKGAQ